MSSFRGEGCEYCGVVCGLRAVRVVRLLLGPLCSLCLLSSAVCRLVCLAFFRDSRLDLSHCLSESVTRCAVALITIRKAA